MHWIEIYQKLFDGDYLLGVEAAGKFVISERIRCLDYCEFSDHLQRAKELHHVVFPSEDPKVLRLGFVEISTESGCNKATLYSVRANAIRSHFLNEKEG